jgi:hypothetical protein
MGPGKGAKLTSLSACAAIAGLDEAKRQNERYFRERDQAPPNAAAPPQSLCAARAAMSDLMVAMVEVSATPSTNAGRKCRWNAAMTSRVGPS